MRREEKRSSRSSLPLSPNLLIQSARSRRKRLKHGERAARVPRMQRVVCLVLVGRSWPRSRRKRGKFGRNRGANKPRWTAWSEARHREFRKSNFGRDGYWLTHALLRILTGVHRLPSPFLLFSSPWLRQTHSLSLHTRITTKKEDSRCISGREYTLALSTLFPSPAFAILPWPTTFPILFFPLLCPRSSMMRLRGSRLCHAQGQFRSPPKYSYL